MAPRRAGLRRALGVSFLGEATMEFRRYPVRLLRLDLLGGRLKFLIEPRSIYPMKGPRRMAVAAPGRAHARSALFRHLQDAPRLRRTGASLPVGRRLACVGSPCRQ